MLNASEKIRKFRSLKGLKQEFMASGLGISTQAYSKIESGETSISIERLEEICKILEIDPLQLLGFDEKLIFTNCEQNGEKGNIGIVNNYSGEVVIALFEQTINSLKSEIEYLRKTLDALLKTNQ